MIRRIDHSTPNSTFELQSSQSHPRQKNALASRRQHADLHRFSIGSVFETFDQAPAYLCGAQATCVGPRLLVWGPRLLVWGPGPVALNSTPLCQAPCCCLLLPAAVCCSP